MQTGYFERYCQELSRVYFRSHQFVAESEILEKRLTLSLPRGRNMTRTHIMLRRRRVQSIASNAKLPPLSDVGPKPRGCQALTHDCIQLSVTSRHDATRTSYREGCCCAAAAAVPQRPTKVSFLAQIQGPRWR